MVVVDNAVLESAGSVVVRFVLTTDVDEEPVSSPGTFRLRTRAVASLLPPSATLATAGDDFAAFDEDVTFAVSEFGRVEVEPGVWRWQATRERRLVIVDDGQLEGAEWFAVQASKRAGASPNVQLSPDRTQAVRIAGNDRKLGPAVTLTATSGGSTLLGGEMVTGAFSVDVTFIGSVTGFGNADISVQNATKRGFSGSGASYSVTITPTTAGVVRVWVPGLAGLTSDDFQSKPSRVFEVLYNTAATVNGPSVASFVASDPVGGSFTATLMYDDGVTGICLDSFEVTGGTVTGFEALNDHPSFSVDHTYYTVVEGRVINETSYGSVRDAVLAGANEHSLLRVTTEYRSGYRVTITPDAAGGTVRINVPAGAGVDRDGRRSQAATLTHTVAQILTDDAVEVTAVRSEVALGERALFRLARVSGTGTPTVNVRVSAPAGVLPDITAPTTTIKVTFADGERFRIVTLDTSPDATITSSDNELTLRIRPGTGYTADPNATTATATLLGPEDFPAASAVVVVDNAVLESAGSVVVRFVLTTDVDEEPVSSPGTFRLRTRAVARVLPPSVTLATAGDDFAAFDEDVTFAVSEFGRVEVEPGVWRWQATRERRLVIVDDGQLEGAEWFAVQASERAGASPNVRLSPDLDAGCAHRRQRSQVGSGRDVDGDIGGIDAAGGRDGYRRVLG